MKQGIPSSQQFILASASPRRQEILSALGIAFKVVSPLVVEENLTESGDAVAIALKRALAKARSVAVSFKERTIVAADTVVAAGTDILGKPVSDDMAYQFLRRLRGREHQVVTALALLDAASRREMADYRISRVSIREYRQDEIATYIAGSGAWDKAGAYAIQDTQFHPVVRVEGCYLNVVGLPVCTLLRLMHHLGIYPSIDPDWSPPGQCPDCSYWAGLWKNTLV